MEATAGQRRGDIKTAVTATELTKNRICGSDCGKTAAVDLTTRWQRNLGLAIASATEMVAAIWQQQWRRKIGLKDLAEVATERR